MPDTHLPVLRVSSTQLEQFRRCKRQWWFERVRKLRTPPQSGSLTFGTVLHAVCERYLSADMLGRDANGDPVNLYPEGWHQSVNKFTGKVDGEISPAEQDLIRRLISAAIEEGVLVRRPDRAIEREFVDTLIDGVEIMGFIDLEHVGEVQDHKTTSGTRWMKSANALAEQIPMLVYAKQHLEALKEAGAAMPEKVTLRYNYFLKDYRNPQVRKVEAVVSVERIQEEWERIQGEARKMLEIRSTVQDGLSEIPDPDFTKDNPCMAYGGCAYSRICTGVENLSEYEKRVDKYHTEGYIDKRIQADRPAMIAKRTAQEDSNMPIDFAARLAAKQASASAAPSFAPTMAPPAPPAPPAVEQPLQPSAPAAAPQATVPAAAPSPGGTLPPPPWAFAGCIACKGIGFNTRGFPCGICQHKSGKSAAPYRLEPQGDGTVVYINKENPDECGIAALPESVQPSNPEQPVKIVEREQQPAPATVEDAAPVEDAPAPAPPAPAEVTENPKRGRGRPRKNPAAPAAPAAPAPAPAPAAAPAPAPGGPVICINCGPIGIVAASAVCARAFLEEIGNEMVEDLGDNDIQHFYDIHAFERRDALRKGGKDLAERLGGRTLVAVGLGSGEGDLRALIDGLIPHASEVIVGVSG